MNIDITLNAPPSLPSTGWAGVCANPFAQEWVVTTKQEQIALIHQANYWKAQYGQLKEKFRKLEESNQFKDAKIKDLQNRLYGKKSEKTSAAKSEKSESSTDAPRKRGQQKGSPSHGRTTRPHLPAIDEVIDLPEEEKRCPHCGLKHRSRPGLTQTTEIIEVEVKAHKRRIIRPAYERHPDCTCAEVPAIITAPPPPRLIPRSPYGVSFWVEALLSKFAYAQPTHRYLQDLRDRGLPVSPGTVAGGLKTIAPLFESMMEALYQKQMTETLFHNDETRWSVFVEIEGKVGYRWYLWMTRSESVVMFDLDPSRSTAVPGAHFAGLQNGQAIIVCDRYSAYKKLARLAGGMILLAFCWAHVRRDFLDAGRSYTVLEPWITIDCALRSGRTISLLRNKARPSRPSISRWGRSWRPCTKRPSD